MLAVLVNTICLYSDIKHCQTNSSSRVMHLTSIMHSQICFLSYNLKVVYTIYINVDKFYYRGVFGKCAIFLMSHFFCLLSSFFTSTWLIRIFSTFVAFPSFTFDHRLVTLWLSGVFLLGGSEIKFLFYCSWSESISFMCYWFYYVLILLLKPNNLCYFFVLTRSTASTNHNRIN